MNKKNYININTELNIYQIIEYCYNRLAIHETENFKPSDHEVKNMCLDLTRLSMIVLLQ